MHDIILIETGSSKNTNAGLGDRYPYPAIGLLSLSSFLKLHGYNVFIIDLRIELFSLDEFQEYISTLSKCPLAVGLTSYTEMVQETHEIVRYVKEVFPESSVIVGGPHASFMGNELLDNCDINFVIRGEGENTLLLLLEHMKHPSSITLESIDGLSYMKGKSTKSTPDRKFINSLDALPIPDYENSPGILEEVYKSKFILVSSRGCPGKCVFCASRALSGSVYRFYSDQWIKAVIVYYLNHYQFHALNFLDDTLTANSDRFFKVASHIKYIRENSKKFTWVCKSRTDVFSEEIATALNNSGCYSVHFGIESSDSEILKKIGKGVTIEKALNAIIVANKHNVGAVCSFIIGHYCDTLEKIEKTLILARILKERTLSSSTIGISTPFPGTPLRVHEKCFGIVISTHPWSCYDLSQPIYSTSEFSENDLRKAIYLFRFASNTELIKGPLTGICHEEYYETLKSKLEMKSNET